ncbi:hypothetical protein LguiB_033899 [Lonicera macranthoides]
MALIHHHQQSFHLYSQLSSPQTRTPPPTHRNARLCAHSAEKPEQAMQLFSLLASSP